MFALLWRTLVGAVALIGTAIVSRLYSRQAPPSYKPLDDVQTRPTEGGLSRVLNRLRGGVRRPDQAQGDVTTHDTGSNDPTRPGAGGPGNAREDDAHQDAAAIALSSGPLQPGWSRPQPVGALARPTYWPMAMAGSIALIVWGSVSSAYLFALGAILIVAAVRGWIKELLHESEPEH